jgi:hypothetical protein
MQNVINAKIDSHNRNIVDYSIGYDSLLPNPMIKDNGGHMLLGSMPLIIRSAVNYICYMVA